MAEDTYYKKGDFIAYLKLLGTLKRPEQHAGYIDSILNNVLKPLGCDVLINDIGKAIQYKLSQNKVKEGLDIIYFFLKKLVWMKKNQSSNKKINVFLTNNKLNLNSINAWPSAITKYQEFLLEEIEKKQITVKTRPTYAVSTSGWNDALRSLKDIEMEILSLKGTDNLFDLFENNYYKILSMILKDSYFFSSNLAENRFCEIVKAIKNKTKLYARESKKVQSNGYFYYNSELDNKEKKIGIIIDSDGNRKVKDLLEEKTGYSISAGYNSIFQHYIISHIWGDAFDPRNFTNYWNIVIVPAWANFLLDKQASQDILARKIINTFKAVCIEHYNMGSMTWKQIDKKFENLEPDGNYVEPGSYEIKVIKEKKQGQEYGQISSATIDIP